MNKKSIFLLVSGIILYSIGFIGSSITSRISMIIGGVLLSIFIVEIGEKLKIKSKYWGTCIKIYGIFFGCVMIAISFGVIISELYN